VQLVTLTSFRAATEFGTSVGIAVAPGYGSVADWDAGLEVAPVVFAEFGVLARLLVVLEGFAELVELAAETLPEAAAELVLKINGPHAEEVAVALLELD